MNTLLVEDDPYVRRLLEHALGSKGYSVRSFDDGLEAWKEYEKGRYPLVILDWMIPGIDGLELCRRIKASQKGRSTFVMVITAKKEAGDLQQVLQAGADDYFAKPVSVRLLEVRLSIAEKQIENLIERRKAEASLARAFSKLEQSHDDLLSILNQLRMGTALTDEGGGIVFLSRVGERLLQLSEDNVLGKHWREAFPFPGTVLDKISALTESGSATNDKILVSPRRSHRKHWVEVEVADDPRDRKRKIFVFYDVSEVHELRKQLGDQARFHELVGKSEPMRQVYQLIQDLGAVDTTILIEGETGTGKELVARAIHASSHRKDKPFLALNCAGLTESLVASQLFGHRRGSFTGAVEDRVGMFEAARGGTIFLDEIGDIPKSVQISLLRVLESREIQRVGEVNTRKIDVRVLSATNHNLGKLVQEGQFRQDLLYRLRVARITLPPLSKRREDIPLLTEWFLRQISASTGKEVLKISDEAFRTLLSYTWPGNVRELRNALEFGVVRSRGGEIRLTDLPPEILEAQEDSAIPLLQGTDNKQAILAALERSGGNRSLAAKLLGMSRATFYRRLSSLKIKDS